MDYCLFILWKIYNFAGCVLLKKKFKNIPYVDIETPSRKS